MTSDLDALEQRLRAAGAAFISRASLTCRTIGSRSGAR